MKQRLRRALRFRTSAYDRGAALGPAAGATRKRNPFLNESMWTATPVDRAGSASKANTHTSTAPRRGHKRHHHDDGPFRRMRVDRDAVGPHDQSTTLARTER